MDVSYRLCIQNYRRWISNPRYYILGVFSIVFIWLFVEPYARFSSDVGVSITPWVFPYIYNSWFINMMTLFLAVMLFCDAPFMNELTPYESVRAGRTVWIVAQILYVLITSLLLVFFLFLLSVLFLVPNIELSMDWGRVLKTLTITIKGLEYGVSGASAFVMQSFTPIKATFLTFSILTLEIAFVGATMFFLNLTIDRKLGNAIGVALAFIPALSPLFSTPSTWWFMPTAWVNTHTLLQSNYYAYPPYWYVYTILITGTCLFFSLSFFIFKNKSVSVLPQL